MVDDGVDDVDDVDDDVDGVDDVDGIRVDDILSSFIASSIPSTVPLNSSLTPPSPSLTTT